MRTFLVGKGRWDLIERPEPTPAPGEVVVAMRAVALNFREHQIVAGIYPMFLKPDLVPASDGAGEVIALGSGVSRWKLGDRVVGTFVQGWESGPFDSGYHFQALGGSLDGVMSEYVRFDERGLVRVPDHLSYEEAATLPCAAVTAWNALFESAPVYHADATVLVQGTGGVAIFALQLARAAGLRVIATTSSPAKVARLRELGADVVIDTRADPDWVAQAIAATGGVGPDHVIDIGGASSLDASLGAVKPGGTVSLIGSLSGFVPINPVPILAKHVRLQGVFVGSRAMFEAMNHVITAHRIRPVIDQVFAFEDAQAALARLVSGTHVGKVVVRVA